MRHIRWVYEQLSVSTLKVSGKLFVLFCFFSVSTFFFSFSKRNKSRAECWPKQYYFANCKLDDWFTWFIAHCEWRSQSNAYTYERVSYSTVLHTTTFQCANSNESQTNSGELLTCSAPQSIHKHSQTHTYTNAKCNDNNTHENVVTTRQ